LVETGIERTKGPDGQQQVGQRSMYTADLEQGAA